VEQHVFIVFDFTHDPDRAAIPALVQVLGEAVGVGINLDMLFVVTDRTFHDYSPLEDPCFIWN